MTPLLSRTLVGLCLTGTSQVFAQAQGPSPCQDVVEKVVTREVVLYEDWQGRPIDTVDASRIPVGQTVIDCAPNGRIRVMVDRRRVWIERFAVEIRGGRSGLSPTEGERPDAGGGRAEGPGPRMYGFGPAIPQAGGGRARVPDPVPVFDLGAVPATGDPMAAGGSVAVPAANAPAAAQQPFIIYAPAGPPPVGATPTTPP